MAHLKIGEKVVNTNGNIPAAGSKAPDFTLTGNDLKDVTLSHYEGKTVVMNIFPSIDTSTCAASVRQFNKRAAEIPETVILCIARDLPYAMRRFCGAEGIDKVVTLSDFRSDQFWKSYGVMMTDGPMRGLFARVVIVVDAHGIIRYEELVPVIGQEPNYDAALAAVRS